jgi:hypothetical protein
VSADPFFVPLHGVQIGGAQGIHAFASEHQVLQEAVLETAHCVDVFVPAWRLVVEADGPTHWTRNLGSPMGNTALKHRLLRTRGAAVVLLCLSGAR